MFLIKYKSFWGDTHVPRGSKVGANGLELSLQNMSRKKDGGEVHLQKKHKNFSSCNMGGVNPAQTGHYPHCAIDY